MSEIIDKVEEAPLLRDLQSLDLPLQASRVYLALLTLRESGIAHLERHTSLHRQLIYNALAVLEERGLAKHVIYNGRKRFSAEPPRRLQALVDDKRRLAENLVVRLTNILPKSETQEFEVFQGDQAFRDHQMQTNLDAEEGETLCLIGGVWEKFYETMGKKGIEEYEKVRVSRKITIRYIGLESQQELLAKAKISRGLFDYRVIPGLNNGLVNTSIWKKSIVFNFFGNPVMAFVLKNEEVAASQLAFFESLWKLGKE